MAKLFYEFIKDPRSGEVYNVGGGRKNSISLLETIDLIEKITGKRIKYDLGPFREGGHIWWITNISKARSHYSNWDIRIGLEKIYKEIY